ncbi:MULTISPECIES: MFS transporter [Aeribacillus]|uniref:MFS transporter n=1 Tax=Aeribacillus TaxID=1055323 RepID=UPI0037BF9C4D
MLLCLFMAGIFAIALIITNQHFPEHTKRVTSILLASNALGGSLIPIIIGWCMDYYPARISFWAFATIMLMMSILVIIKSRKR